MTGPNSQDVYVALILYILAIAASKGSALLFVQRLVASKIHRLFLRGLGVILTVWTITAVLTTSLRCGLPHPWERAEGECLDMVRVSPGHLVVMHIATVSSSLNQVLLSDAFSVVDITIDIALVVLPITLVWGLHMHRHEKAIVSLAFTFRLR